MDYMRSAYTTYMQFDDAGEIVRQIRWYRAPVGAKDFPGPHLFGSTNWAEGGQPILGPGERWDYPKVYSKGATPAGPLGIPGLQCGPADYFVNGVPSNAPPLEVYPDGVGKCCYSPPGGLGIGGAMLRPNCAPYNYTYRTWVLIPGLDWQLMAYVPGPPGVFVFEWDSPPPLHIGLVPSDPPCFNSGYKQSAVITDPAGSKYFPLDFVYWNPVTWQSVFVIPETSAYLPGQTIVFWQPPYSYIGLGGLDVGGRATSEDLPWTSSGGVKAGGKSTGSVAWSSLGGLGLGGGLVSSVPASMSGGLRPGGASSVNLVRFSAGGLQIGGSNTSSVSRTGSGGLKPGGEYSSYVGVVTACCGSTPVNENLSVTNVTTGNSGTASYSSGVGGWVVPLTVVSPQCMLKCQNIGSGNKWYVIEDGNACFTPSVMSATCGPPFSASGTVAYSGKPGCPSGSFSIHFSG